MVIVACASTEQQVTPSEIHVPAESVCERRQQTEWMNMESMMTIPMVPGRTLKPQTSMLASSIESHCCVVALLGLGSNPSQVHGSPTDTDYWFFSDRTFRFSNEGKSQQPNNM